jgi:uncharacterized protein YacL
VTIRSFKQLFSTVFALILGGLFAILGLHVRAWVGGITRPGLPQAFRDMVLNQTYNTFMIAALCILGILVGTIFGPLAAQSIINMGAAYERYTTRERIAVATGLLLGVMTSLPFFLLLLQIPALGIPLAILVCFAFVYLGVRGMMSIKDEFKFIGAPAGYIPAADGDKRSMERCKILDTNVIIDGRIADICRTGFVEGPIYIPGFVLDELQHIADSADSLKRARGRRGLDILNNMQKELPLLVRSLDHLVQNAHSPNDEVDARLVRLAKELKGDIITNDFNLNKVAALQGVTVLNVNELANAVKPVVLPGEEMPVTIIKEGKEQNQGVAYLDDGTMVVVEDGRKHIGEHFDVVVTSVLQTVAGKMIFARMRTDAEEEEEQHDGGPHNPGGRARYKIR